MREKDREEGGGRLLSGRISRELYLEPGYYRVRYLRNYLLCIIYVPRRPAGDLTTRFHVKLRRNQLTRFSCDENRLSRFCQDFRSTFLSASHPVSTRNRLDCEQSTNLESHQRALDSSITLERPCHYFPLGYTICRKPCLITCNRLWHKLSCIIYGRVRSSRWHFYLP